LQELSASLLYYSDLVHKKLFILKEREPPLSFFILSPCTPPGVYMRELAWGVKEVGLGSPKALTYLFKI